MAFLQQQQMQQPIAPQDQQHPSGRSRWLGLGDNYYGNNIYGNQQPVSGQLISSDTGMAIGDSSSGGSAVLVAPDGTVRRYYGLVRRDDEGPDSDFARCYYSSVEQPLICEKVAGCCVDGCCPKDVQWLGGIWVLIAVVIAIFIIGFAAAIVCYHRSKANEKKQALNTYYAPSQQPYGSEVGAGSKYGYGGAPY